ncbi:lipopolysaccharide biosynthesis protein [Gottfriedia acidiceleris]|uniref:lipopolysaccharide biosynthesis protein n=1 Tax=Gottfriedia acidiceleris TaxID=371036 RepID=UPI003D2325B6
MNNNKNLVEKFFQYAIGSGITLLLGFISSPLTTRLINPENFGKFSMFTLFANVSNLIILLGLDNSFVRYFYEETPGNRKKLLFNILKISIAACSVFSILIIIFSNFISIRLFGIFNYQILILMVLNNLFMLLNRYALLVVRMQQKGKLFSLLQIYQKLSNIVLIVILFIPLNKGFLTLINASVLSNIFVTIIAIWKEREYWDFKNIKKIELKITNDELLKYGIPLVFTFLLTWLFQSTDRLFINYYKGSTELGVYSAAFSIIALLNALQTAFTTFWVPVAYERYKIDPNDKKFFEDASQIVIVIMFLISIGLIFIKDFVVYLLGTEYRQASFIMPFLVFMPLMYTISETTVNGINFMKKTNYHIWVALSSAIINVLGNLILVPIYGAVGAAISTGIAYIVFFTVRTLISKNLYKLNYQLTKMYTMTLLTCVFALYASFNTFNWIFFILGSINLMTLIILYKEIIKNSIIKLKKNRIV